MTRIASSTLALALLLLLAGCGGGSGSDACAGKASLAGTVVRTIESGGRTRTFQITAPESALRGEPVPLVLVFHGVLSNGATIQTVTGMPEKAAEEGFLTAAGDGIGMSWNAGVCCNPAAADGIDDVQFTRDMVAAIEAEYCVDSERIYATGFSNGGAMVARLFCDASDLFASLAPVGGSIALFPCEPALARPNLIINNLDDPLVPFDLGELTFSNFTTLNACTDQREERSPAATTTCDVAPECADATSTVLCAVDGIGHVWPGGAQDPTNPFRATDAVWRFFDGGGV